MWGCTDSSISTSTSYGTGSNNTDEILSECADRPIAASIARDYDGGGYDDWFLPSKDELDILYQNRGAIGNFNTGGDYYWSSSEYASNNSWSQRFSDGTQNYNNKHTTNRVRAVRAF